VRLLPVQADLPIERRDVTALTGIAAITFDFGNTLVPVTRSALRQVVEGTADAVCGRWPDLDHEAFLAVWAEERERQFREEVPQFREVDLAERLVRVFARLRGMEPPPADRAWDDPRAAERSDPADVRWAIEQYSRAFVDGLPPAPGVGELLERLAATRILAILSNWPLAATIDRYADAHGWTAHLRAIVVSQRVGTIKPHPAIFDAARTALGDPPPASILHVGDDWAADVVGAAAAGWRTAWLTSRPHESPLPSSERDGSVVPDLELATLDELEARLAPNDQAASAFPDAPSPFARTTDRTLAG
jgi:HAD superfamily hydrolase (TIGR01509 family)